MTKPGVWIWLKCAICCFFQIIQELEKQRIEVLCNILTRYNLNMCSFGETLKHVRNPDLNLAHKYIYTHLDAYYYLLYVYFWYFQGQRQIEQVVQRVDMDKDIQTLVKENHITAEDNKAEFLMADYFVSVTPFQRQMQSSLQGAVFDMLWMAYCLFLLCFTVYLLFKILLYCNLCCCECIYVLRYLFKIWSQWDLTDLIKGYMLWMCVKFPGQLL